MTEFKVSFDFFKYFEGGKWNYESIEYGYEVAEEAGRWFSEEVGDYMPLWEMAKAELEKYPEGDYRVTLEGSMGFTKDYWGEVDADYDITSTKVEKIVKENYE